MRLCGEHYEYIVVYIDDLAIASKDPKAIVDELMRTYNYKLKGVRLITYHLGCDYAKDPDDNLYYSARKHTEKLLSSYEKMYGEQPKLYNSSLERNDHLELDDTPLLSELDIVKY